jgi:hypothetical protein
VVSPVNASRLPSRAEPRASLGVGAVGWTFPVGDLHLLFFASFLAHAALGQERRFGPHPPTVRFAFHCSRPLRCREPPLRAMTISSARLPLDTGRPLRGRIKRRRAAAPEQSAPLVIRRGICAILCRMISLRISRGPSRPFEIARLISEMRRTVRSRRSCSGRRSMRALLMLRWRQCGPVLASDFISIPSA